MQHIDLSNLARKRHLESRSISAENPQGQKGRGGMAVPPPWTGSGFNAARELGQGWKVEPCITIPAGEVATLMDVEGPAVIRHLWITVDQKFYRDLILRIYWDGQIGRAHV